MNIELSVPVDIENALRRRAATRGLDLLSYARQVLTEEVADEIPATRKFSHEEFKAKIQEIIDLHPVSNGMMDDSRESIYAGCGE